MVHTPHVVYHGLSGQRASGDLRFLTPLAVFTQGAHNMMSCSTAVPATERLSPTRATASGQADTTIEESFFFPGQFAGRAAMASMAELAQAHADLDFTAGELARKMGITLPSRVGVQDLMRAADLAGLSAKVQRVAVSELQHLTLPVLLLSADTDSLPAVLVVAHCDGRYVVTHDHASVIPTNAMGPMHMLAQGWAPDGMGWVLTVQSQVRG